MAANRACEHKSGDHVPTDHDRFKQSGRLTTRRENRASEWVRATMKVNDWQRLGRSLWEKGAIVMRIDWQSPDCRLRCKKAEDYELRHTEGHDGEKLSDVGLTKFEWNSRWKKKIWTNKRIMFKLSTMFQCKSLWHDWQKSKRGTKANMMKAHNQ